MATHLYRNLSLWSRDSSVGIVINLRTGRYRDPDLIPGRRKTFFCSPKRRDRLRTHPASYSMHTGDYFRGDKVTGAWRWPFISILCPVNALSYASTATHAIMAWWSPNTRTTFQNEFTVSPCWYYRVCYTGCLQLSLFFASQTCVPWSDHSEAWTTSHTSHLLPTQYIHMLFAWYGWIPRAYVYTSRHFAVALKCNARSATSISSWHHYVTLAGVEDGCLTQRLLFYYGLPVMCPRDTFCVLNRVCATVQSGMSGGCLWQSARRMCPFFICSLIFA